MVVGLSFVDNRPEPDRSMTCIKGKYSYTRDSVRRFNIGRVIFLNKPPASVISLFFSQTTAKPDFDDCPKKSRKFKRVLVFTPTVPTDRGYSYEAGSA